MLTSLELLSLLTKIQGLRVATRASSFHFKGRNEDPAVIGERLNVATLLDGSVWKAGNRVRISVQLVKAADRVQLWSETYDRSLDDIFAVQEGIAEAVVKELRTALLAQTPDTEALEEAMREPASWSRLSALAYAHIRAGRVGGSNEPLLQLVRNHSSESAYQIAQLYSARGEVDEALTWLERAFAARDTGAVMSRSDPLLRQLHGDPRWGVLMKKLGFG